MSTVGVKKIKSAKQQPQFIHFEIKIDGQVTIFLTPRYHRLMCDQVGYLSLSNMNTKMSKDKIRKKEKHI